MLKNYKFPDSSVTNLIPLNLHVYLPLSVQISGFPCLLPQRTSLWDPVSVIYSNKSLGTFLHVFFLITCMSYLYPSQKVFFNFKYAFFSLLLIFQFKENHVKVNSYETYFSRSHGKYCISGQILYSSIIIQWPFNTTITDWKRALKLTPASLMNSFIW